MSSVSCFDSLENMLFGDPVYDERGQVVKRNFGLTNAGMIVVFVALGIGLFKEFSNVKPKSGKKKMKGGMGLDLYDRIPSWVKSVGLFLLGCLCALLVAAGFFGISQIPWVKRHFL